jgi:NADH:ubiquinone oxidoreductase subunit E
MIVLSDGHNYIVLTISINKYINKPVRLTMEQRAEKHRITICMGSSCFSRGNSVNAELVQRLIQEGKIRAELQDAEVTGTLCEGLCKDGPIVIIDGVIHRQVSPMVLQDLLTSSDRVPERT